MLDAIRRARETINMECYIFKTGEIGEQFVDALCERARAGVRVTLVMDAIGSFGAFRKLRKPLREAGARVDRVSALHVVPPGRLNNRTHRELLVVDGASRSSAARASPTGGRGRVARQARCGAT